MPISYHDHLSNFWEEVRSKKLFANFVLFFLTITTELLRALESCMKHPTPKPFMLQIIYDIKSWIAEHAEELHEHTVPKCFKFKLNQAGKAVMYYRNWSHEQWQGPIGILKVMSKTKLSCASTVTCL